MVLLLRAAEPSDLPALATLEAQCVAPSLCGGAEQLGRWACRGFPHAVVATDGEIVGALVPMRFGQLSDLRGSDALHAWDIQRDEGGLLLVQSLWLSPDLPDHQQVEAQLLRYTMLLALQSDDVREVVMPMRCGFKITEHSEDASSSHIVSLRSQACVTRQMNRGAKLLQMLLHAWWPACGTEPAGTPPRTPSTPHSVPGLRLAHGHFGRSAHGLLHTR